MRRGILFVGLLLALAAPAASASQAPTRTTRRMTLAESVPVKRTVACVGNLTPYVYVNGQELIVADLSNHAQTATFYGMGSVVRLDQHGPRVYVLGITTLPRARLRVVIVCAPVSSTGS